jgi:hypothetical protein
MVEGSIAALRKSYPDLKIEKGMILAPCEKILQISDDDYAVPWDLMGR